MSKPIIIERHESSFGRYATVEVDGKRYFCGVERGRRIRIPFKPNGKNIGFKWEGFVRDATRATIWSGLVSKGTGVSGLLRGAGITAAKVASSEKPKEAES